MSITCAALLRGVNVGRAKRVPMAELRTLLESLGYGSVRTLLNSGNAVFTAPARGARTIATRVEQALEERFGFPVPTVVVTAPELDAVVQDNPFADVDEPSRLLVAFVRERAALSALQPLAKAPAPDGSRLACGTRAAYIWCPGGLLDSPLPIAAEKLLRHTVLTTRNWSTTLKLHALVQRP